MKNNIRTLRKAAGITMKQLGDLMGVSESAISLYETGKAEPDISMLKKLADYFSVSIDYLLGATKKPTRSCELSEDEYTHLMLFRAASEDARLASEAVLKVFVPHSENVSAERGANV